MTTATLWNTGQQERVDSEYLHGQPSVSHCSPQLHLYCDRNLGSDSQPFSLILMSWVKAQAFLQPVPIQTELKMVSINRDFYPLVTCGKKLLVLAK